MTEAKSDEGNPWANGKGRLEPPELFHRYSNCVVRVEVTLASGDLSNGTAFHIGGGAFVTARHVVEGVTNPTLFDRDSTGIEEEGHALTEILLHPSDDIDLAIITADLWKGVFGDHGADDPPKGER